MHLSTKTYSPEQGFSCCFRQWRADHSHCSKLHGYALGFKFTFASDGLDERNWVMDFGGLKTLKAALADTFDHTLVIAEDDPERDVLEQLAKFGLARVLVLPAVGCERFAEYAHKLATEALKAVGVADRVRCVHVECFEHSGNSAIYIPDEAIQPL